MNNNASVKESNKASGIGAAGWALVLFSLVYPVVRYNIFGKVPWENIPLYVFNKSFCIYTSFALLAFSFYRWNGETPKSRKWWNMTLWSAGAHILFSLCILSPGYYGKMFLASGKLTLFGEISILGGVIAAIVYWNNYCNSQCMKVGVLPLNLGAFFLSAHLLFIGWKGWWTPEKWHGGLPPITLLCFIPAVVAFVLLCLPAKQAGDRGKATL